MEDAPIPSTHISFPKFNHKAANTCLRGQLGTMDPNQMVLCPRKTWLERKKVRRGFGEATSHLHSNLTYRCIFCARPCVNWLLCELICSSQLFYEKAVIIWPTQKLSKTHRDIQVSHSMIPWPSVTWTIEWVKPLELCNKWSSELDWMATSRT